MRLSSVMFLFSLLALANGCATVEHPNTEALKGTSDKAARSVASSEVPDDFRARTLNKVASALRSGDCPTLSETQVSGVNGGWVAEWQVIADLYRERGGFDRRNLAETVTKMVEGSGSTMMSLTDFNNIPDKYRKAVEGLTVRGPQSFFVLKSAGKETVIRFGPYSNGAIQCEVIN